MLFGDAKKMPELEVALRAALRRAQRQQTRGAGGVGQYWCAPGRSEAVARLQRLLPPTGGAQRQLQGL